MPFFYVPSLSNEYEPVLFKLLKPFLFEYAICAPFDPLLRGVQCRYGTCVGTVHCSLPTITTDKIDRLLLINPLVIQLLSAYTTSTTTGSFPTASCSKCWRWWWATIWKIPNFNRLSTKPSSTPTKTEMEGYRLKNFHR